MSIYVKTSGVIGLENLNKNTHNLLHWRSFVEGVDVYEARVTGMNGGVEVHPVVHTVFLDPEYEVEELKGGVGSESPYIMDVRVAKRAVKVWAHAPEGHDLIVHGKEFGCGFVPMKADIREAMRRETELLSIFVAAAKSYTISMPGHSKMTVFNNEKV
jgi:hypothetical protein